MSGSGAKNRLGSQLDTSKFDSIENLGVENNNQVTCQIDDKRSARRNKQMTERASALENRSNLQAKVVFQK